MTQNNPQTPLKVDGEDVISRRECDLIQLLYQEKLETVNEKIDVLGKKVDWTLKLLIVATIGIYLGRSFDTNLIPVFAAQASVVYDPIYSTVITFLYAISV